VPQEGGQPHSGPLSYQNDQIDFPGLSTGVLYKEMLCRSDFTRLGLQS
jgi:hypothetical protein